MEYENNADGKQKMNALNIPIAIEI